MTDRELLEVAAKAAGIGACPCRMKHCHKWYGVNGQPWNPLDDDGDALRLAVRLGLEVDIGSTVAIAFKRKSQQYEEQADRNSDIYAATRRAIVRAAAEIGRHA